MKNYLTLILLLISTAIFSQTTPGEYTINNVHVNTKYSDFGTTFFGKDKVVFAAPKDNTFITKSTWSVNNQAFLDLYIADITHEGELDNKKPILGDVNNKYHEGIVTFTKDLKTVYFSANNYTKNNKAKKDSTGMVNIQLYKADVLPNGEWKDVVKLPFNNDEYSTGHPALSIDDKRLYFVSDRPESIGKTDIFYVDIQEDGTFGKPVNMGPKINTTEREMFPFISDDNILYFSSDGHPGYGELDVFATKIFDNTISEPLNLRGPVNSDKDDFSFIIDDTKHKGFFSSNRKGGKGDDDIYGFYSFPPLHIEGKQVVTGIITNIKTGKLITGATVVLQDINGNEIERIKLPEVEESQWQPFKNTDNFDKGKVSLASGDLEKLSITKTVSNESPATDDEVEFTVALKNLGKDDLKNIKVEDVLPEGYTYVSDDTENTKGITYSDDKVYVANIVKGEEKTVKVRAKVIPIQKASSFTFNVENNKDYKIVITAPGYLRKEVDIKTINDTGIQALDLNLDLDEELRVVDDKIMININTIYFDFDKWNIRLDAAKELDKVIAVMKSHPSMVIESGSHTDSRATEAYNQTLSEKRAKATVDYIVAGGIDRNRISAKGYGEKQLVNNCSSFVKCTREQHQLNRRTEFVIVNDNERFASKDATLKDVIVGEDNKTKVRRGIANQDETEQVQKDDNASYHIIVGSFKKRRDAEKKIVELNRKGYQATIVNDNRSIRFRVATEGYNDKEIALNKLAIIRDNLNKKAWLLKLDQPLKNEDKVGVIKENKVVSKAKENKQQEVDTEIVVNDSTNTKFSGEVIKAEQSKYIKIAPIYFDFDSWSISDNEIKQLDKVVQIMRDNPSIIVEAGAHTDTKNIEAYNLALSKKRAKTIVEYIVSKGIAPDRIIGVGYGETRLTNHCKSFVKCTPEEQQANRRIEFMVIDGNGYPDPEIIDKKGEKYINTNPIYFDFDKHDIRKDAAYELDRIAKIMKEHPTMKIVAESHTDSQNTESYNQELSEKRAISTKDYLVSKGIDSSRISTIGYGETRLTNHCKSFVKCTPEEHQANRRTEFRIVNM